MKIFNLHKRIIQAHHEEIGDLMESLGSSNDQIWPINKWPRMKLSKGLEVGSEGGHGPIRYTVSKYEPGKSVEFTFTRPRGFIGVHRFEILKSDTFHTLIQHEIKMSTSWIAYLKWILAIKWLHDALIENAFDRIDSRFLNEEVFTKWNIWVRILRFVLK